MKAVRLTKLQVITNIITGWCYANHIIKYLFDVLFTLKPGEKIGTFTKEH